MNLHMLLAMKHSPVRNYVVPGLTSWLIGSPSPKGTVRLFECEREHMEPIIPHSHRFNFQCWVLKGTVRNRIWRQRGFEGDWYMQSEQSRGRMGGYELSPKGRARYVYTDTVYNEGEWYSMSHEEIHSIYFGRDTKVLFFEGAECAETTTILEPIANDQHIQTFKVEPWMFDRGTA